MLNVIYAILIAALFVNCKTQATQLQVVSEHWPPFVIDKASDNQEITGIVTQKIKQILSYTNLNYSLNVYPWARSYQIALNQPNVLIYSIYKTEERLPHFHWFCPIHPISKINLYKLKSNPADINTLASLKKLKIGILRHDHAHNYFLSQGFVDGVNLDISADETVNLKKLLTGRIDAAVQSNLALVYRLKNTNFTMKELEAGLQLHQNYDIGHCMALSKSSSPKVVKQLNQAFSYWLTQ